LMGTRVKTSIVRDHWADLVRLVASLKAETVAPSAMLKKLSVQAAKPAGSRASGAGTR
jgi:TnpA family transposase